MKYRHFVFDLDGTLLDTAQTALSCLQRVLQEVLGRSIAMKELEGLFGIPCLEIAQMYHVPDPEYVVSKWQEYDAKEKINVRPFRGVVELLQTLLNNGYKLGLVTSRTQREIAQQLPMFAMDGMFGVIVGSDDTKRRKPYPDPLEKYMQQAQAVPEEVLYIGDSIHDMMCAKSAGADFGYAGWGALAVDNDPKFDYYFPDPTNVLDIL